MFLSVLVLQLTTTPMTLLSTSPCGDLISLADLRFQCDLLVMRSDGTSFNTEDCVCPCNNILSTLFQNVQVTLAVRSISDPSSLYFVRAYLENLLGYTENAMLGQLSVEGLYHDSTQVPNVTGAWVAAVAQIPSHASFQNLDQKYRFDMVKSGRTLQLSERIHCDLFQQDKPLLPGVSLSLKFVRSRTAVAFTAVAADKLTRVAIRNPKLFVRKYNPAASYLNSLSKNLLNSPAI